MVAAGDAAAAAADFLSLSNYYYFSIFDLVLSVSSLRAIPHLSLAGFVSCLLSSAHLVRWRHRRRSHWVERH